jgi:hypothetical protein
MHRLTSARALKGTLVLCLGLVLGSLVGGTALADHQFSDVGPNNQFHDDVDWLVQHQITTGFPDGTFRPTQPVSRQAMAAFLSRANNDLRVATGTSSPTIGSTEFNVSATCDPDERAVAGGGSVSLGGIFLTVSRPSANEQEWVVRYQTVGGELLKPSRVDAWALCVPDTLTAP